MKKFDAASPDWPELIGVIAIHVVLLGLAIWKLSPASDIVTPPRIVGMLVSDQPAPVTEIAKPAAPKVPPKPVAPTPAKTVTQKPLPATPVSERAITAAPPAAPAQPAPAPQAAGGPVSLPRTDATHLNNPKPVYPAASRRLGEQGRVLLSVYILPDGSVSEIKLKQSSGHPRLDQAALDAVKRWRYVPAKRGGEPIPYWYVQPIAFALDS